MKDENSTITRHYNFLICWLVYIKNNNKIGIMDEMLSLEDKKKVFKVRDVDSRPLLQLLKYSDDQRDY